MLPPKDKQRIERAVYRKPRNKVCQHFARHIVTQDELERRNSRRATATGKALEYP